MIEASWGIRRHLRRDLGPLAFALAMASVAVGCAGSDATSTGDAIADAGADTGAAAADVDIPGRTRPEQGDDEDGAGLAGTSDGGANDDGRGPPALVTVKQGCDMRADRLCSKLQDCSEFFLRLVFGKADVCRARLAADCMAQASAPDVSITQYSLVRCAQEISAQTCAEIIDRQEPDACNPMGLRREGKRCGGNLQCATGFCAASGDMCGRCEAKRGAGESCESDAACMSGLHCSGKGKCVRRGSLGDACGGENQECGTLLACRAGRCAVPLVADAPCTNTDECTRAVGQVCAAPNGGVGNALALPVLQCRASVLGAPGTICREGNSLTAYCAGGQANCVEDDKGIFRCVAPAMDGQPCGDKANGRSCIMPAVCVAGACRLGPVTSCQP
ncbi:MAG: hypothetical protein SF187_30660 [Deltaproteobacteria bacterium]|nr:hypothetical protein [Deltaproteobacteria bacterium]